jgi:hypothetical protein
VIHFPLSGGSLDLGPGEGAVSDGRFHVAEAPLGIGGNHLHVNVHDATSWSAHLPWAIERDPSAPDVQLVHPRDGSALVEETASLALSFGAPVTLVSVNGAADGRAFPAGVAEDALSVRSARTRSSCWSTRERAPCPSPSCSTGWPRSIRRASPLRRTAPS